MVSITVSTPGKPTINLDFPGKHPQNVTIKEVKSAIHAKFPKLVPNRQRLTFPSSGEVKPTPLVDESQTLASYGVPEGGKLRLKDLGKQVAYRALYLWEYIGVIILNPAMFFLSQSSYASYIPFWGPYTPSTLQTITRNLLLFHFVKRFGESIFIHTYSRPTVPLAYVIRNIAYYWGLVGIVMPLSLYRPAYSANALKNSFLGDEGWIAFWTVWIFASELLNLNAHLHLASIRQPPGKPRKFPTGLGFGTVVCANYWFELLGLFGMFIMTGCDIGMVPYIGIAVWIMSVWAGQKYARYKKEFDPKVFPGKRFIMFPPLY